MADDLERELAALLPAGIPRRQQVIAGAVRHAGLMLAANERLNLTRITVARDVAVKHVLDCLWPWERLAALLPEGAAPIVADLGSGAGYPGLLLALAFPHARLLLLESIQKKAAFLVEAARSLGLANVEVRAVRAEELLATLPVDLVVARAVGSARDLLRLLKPARASLGHLLLYKGPGVEQELAQAAKDAEKLGLAGTITARFELPDGAGSRALLEYVRARP